MDEKPNGTAVPSSLDTATPEAPVMESAPEAAAPAETAATKSAFDAAALEAQLKEYDPAITLDNFGKHLKKLRNTNAELGRKLQEYQAANEPKEAFWQLIDSNPALRERVSSVFDEFSQEAPGAPAPNLGFVSLEERLNRIEMGNLISRTEQEIASLEARGWPVDEATRDEIVSGVLESRGGETAQSLYVKKNFNILLEHERKRAAEDAVAALKINNDSYNPVPPARGQAAPSNPAPVDVSKMSSSEYNAYAIEAIRRRLSG